MGSSLPYILASSVFRMLEKPVGIGGLCIFWGYLQGMLGGAPRFDVPGFRDELQRWQHARLMGLLRHGKVR